MTIKHLVISGGGPNLIQTLGALQHLEKNKFIDLNNIETIYGTSAGAIVGTMICMKFDWETINDYIIKRPWQDVFKITVDKILEAYTKKVFLVVQQLKSALNRFLTQKIFQCLSRLRIFINIQILSYIFLHLK